MPPIALDTPEQIAAPATKAEVVAFFVDVKQSTVEMVINLTAADGTMVKSYQRKSSLLDANGAPRFAPGLYSGIKALLYQLAAEDGHVPPGVVE